MQKKFDIVCFATYGVLKKKCIRIVMTWYIRYGRRISRDPRLRKWDENWNISEFRELATLPGREATLTWALMGLT